MQYMYFHKSIYFYTENISKSFFLEYCYAGEKQKHNIGQRISFTALFKCYCNVGTFKKL